MDKKWIWIIVILIILVVGFTIYFMNRDYADLGPKQVSPPSSLTSTPSQNPTDPLGPAPPETPIVKE